MEANNIITQIQSLKKRIGESQLTVIEIDLVKKQLLECYELLFSGIAAKPTVQEENATTFDVPLKQETPIIIAEKEEINPFVAVIEEEVKRDVKQDVIPPVKTPPLPVEKEEDSSVGNITIKAEAESINEHFENDGSSLNDRFQLSVNKGLNERTTQGDLKKLIDFNRQFVFIQELFNNDATAYMKTIETLNNSHSLEEAFAYLNKEIVHFYKWRPDLQSVKLFEKLVRQKFGA
jgi:hypothetical protein